MPHGPIVLNRRNFLAAATAAAGSMILPRRLFGADGFELIARQKNPDNLECPAAALDTFVTPTERFFVRSHFAVPELDSAAFRLKIEGAVKRPTELNLKDLAELDRRTATVTFECAGNGRAFLDPRPAGVTWQCGAVGNATWTGVPLSTVLERAGVKPEAVEVAFEGSDIGETPVVPGRIRFTRSLTVDRATKGDVLLATHMNGKPLTPAHGAPLRLIVPGWYGVANVKWLSRIVVLDRAFAGFYQALDYTYWHRESGLVELRTLGAMAVKSMITAPFEGGTVKAGQSTVVAGAAWTGEGDIAKVELSTDGGNTWSVARLLDDAVRGAWRRWEFAWNVPAGAGKHLLVSRATDSRGRTQGTKRDLDMRSYVINHLVATAVTAR